MESLEEKLLKYSESDYYGFHMPGHKRNRKKYGTTLPYNIDITEIEGFDDLHHCEGILKDAQIQAARVFGAEESYFLINGSTVGNLSAILGATKSGDKIIIARNNHKSVYNAVIINQLQPIYVYPSVDEHYGILGAVLVEDVEEILKKESNVKAIVIVSPTYEGVISDVKGISEIAHSYGVPLIVDEAHGAHLGNHEYFYENSNLQGADVVIHSIHKTLPSLTQTGLLHLNGNLVNRKRVVKYLKMLQSSSPSYVLMASIAKCINLLDEKGVELFIDYVNELKSCREQLKGLLKLELVKYDTREDLSGVIYDKSKLVISTKRTSISGVELSEKLLNKYHLQMEMSGLDYVIAMTSIGDTKEGFERLVFALKDIDREIEYKSEMEDSLEIGDILRSMKKAEKVGNTIENDEFYYVYPPGIPLVAPGENVTDEVRKLMKLYKENGFVVHKS